MKQIKLNLTNDIGKLREIQLFLDEKAETWGLSPKLVFNLNLVLEELFSNIVFYAYDDLETHDIEFTFTLTDQVLVISIRENGKAFNPLERNEMISLDEKLENKKIGGLGIYLVKKLVDEVTYERVGDYNLLTIKIKR